MDCMECVFVIFSFMSLSYVTYTTTCRNCLLLNELYQRNNIILSFTEQVESVFTLKYFLIYFIFIHNFLKHSSSIFMKFSPLNTGINIVSRHYNFEIILFLLSLKHHLNTYTVVKFFSHQILLQLYNHKTLFRREFTFVLRS